MEQGSGFGTLFEKYSKVFLAIGILLAIFLGAKSIKELKSIAYVGRDVPAMNTIIVSGTGEVFKVPDLAIFSFTVESESLVVNTAQTRVNENISDIIKFLKDNGVEEKDIKTQGYNVYPRYEYDTRSAIYPYPEGDRNLAAYVVSQMIEVKVRKIDDAGKLISGVGELGATQISGISFTVDDDEEVLREARQKAIADAQKKAKQLSKDLGVRLVRIVNFSDGGNYPLYYAKDMAYGMGGASEAMPQAAQLPAGENQFVSNVNITYEIR